MSRLRQAVLAGSAGRVSVCVSIVPKGDPMLDALLMLLGFVLGVPAGIAIGAWLQEKWGIIK
jgi:hypothetical protein